MNQPIHILNQLGVLTSFSVAKKITEDDISKYFSKYKRKGKSNKQIEEMLREKILSEIDDAINQHKIPGLITPQEFADELGLDKNIVQRMPELNKLILILSQKIMEKNYDKMSLCYFINSMVNILGISEDDFEKFHKNVNGEDEGDDSSEDGGYEDLPEDEQ